MSADTDVPTESWREAHRNLTDAEIRALSFELKICFYLAPWNISASEEIKSVNDWADVMGIEGNLARRGPVMQVRASKKAKASSRRSSSHGIEPSHPLL